MSMAEADERSGRPIHVVGRYALFDRIATGGMATVHLGRLVGAAGFARTVAIKRLRRTYARDPKFAEMFIDEARVAARIRHPNVAATIDVVRDGGELLLVLEYVHGESLSRILSMKSSKQGLEPRIAVAIAVGALHGLHAAHQARSERGAALGIIHRDVSPQNILLGLDGVPRVVDFGIAKAMGRMQRTDKGEVKGKPRYMAPEQLQGDAVTIDHRVDVFSMGTVVWEALTGRPLFDHPNFMGTLKQVLDMPILAPHQVNPGVEEKLSRVVLRALHRDRDQRFATALDFAVALEEAAPARGMASQHALGAWLRERATSVLDQRQALIEQIESFELTLGGDRPSFVDAGPPPSIEEAPDTDGYEPLSEPDFERPSGEAFDRDSLGAPIDDGTPTLKATSDPPPELATRRIQLPARAPGAPWTAGLSAAAAVDPTALREVDTARPPPAPAFRAAWILGGLVLLAVVIVVAVLFATGQSL